MLHHNMTNLNSLEYAIEVGYHRGASRPAEMLPTVFLALDGAQSAAEKAVADSHHVAYAFIHDRPAKAFGFWEQPWTPGLSDAPQLCQCAQCVPAAQLETETP